MRPLILIQTIASLTPIGVGEGVVIDCVEALGDHEVTVHFEGDVGVKRLLLSFARLEKVEG